MEINSSFYRSHRASTYARWSVEVPAAFRFSVKIPKSITHTNKLCSSVELLDALDSFAHEVLHLGERLGCLLVQLPPSLAFDHDVADDFFREMRARFAVNIVCEPRHESWFTAAADALLVRHEVGRVAADPARVPPAAVPGGWPGIVYYRLHGSPRMYYSEYDVTCIEQLASTLTACARQGADTWCIFDNTAAGAALHNGLQLLQALQ